MNQDQLGCWFTGEDENVFELRLNKCKIYRRVSSNTKFSFIWFFYQGIINSKSEHNLAFSDFQIDIQNTAKEEAAYKAMSLNRIRLELLLEWCVWDSRLHSLMSSDCRVPDSKTIDQKHEALAAIKTMKHREQQGKGSAKKDSKWEGVYLERGDKALEYHFNSKFEFEYFHIFIFRQPNLVKCRSCSCQLFWSSKEQIPLSNIIQIRELQRVVGSFPWNSTWIHEESSDRSLNKIRFSRNPWCRNYSLWTYCWWKWKLHIPLGSDKYYIVSDYEDDFCSIIACALALLKDMSVVTQDLEAESCSSRNFPIKLKSVICP